MGNFFHTNCINLVCRLPAQRKKGNPNPRLNDLYLECVGHLLLYKTARSCDLAAGGLKAKTNHHFFIQVSYILKIQDIWPDPDCGLTTDFYFRLSWMHHSAHVHMVALFHFHFFTVHFKAHAIHIHLCSITHDHLLFHRG